MSYFFWLTGYVLAGLISSNGPDSNPGQGAKLGQANSRTYAIGLTYLAVNWYQNNLAR